MTLYSLNPYITTGATVAAVWGPVRRVYVTEEGGTAIAARASMDGQGAFVDEDGAGVIIRWRSDLMGYLSGSWKEMR